MGIVASVIDESFPPKSKFNVDDIPDLSGKVVIVTGANSEWLTKNGYDLQIGSMVLGHFYLTKLLLPVLISGAKSSPDGKSRVVHTSSIGSLGPSDFDFNVLKDGPARRKMHPGKLYSLAKLGNVLLSNELAKRYGDQGLVSISCNPGNLESDLLRHSPWLLKFVIGLFLHPTKLGALTQLWAGTSAEASQLNGEYLIPWARVGKPNVLALDSKLCSDLWEWMEEQVQDV
ncbi:hypothetical protein FA15DRAFT_417920 [Coprinopsis marcescibilis]|uniref:NAD(P)-binding protein n=1 Tax=Coprinopsis marcescibilis TaxID=230819 RepID=A0A5C3KX39_COPMA|nr:hypothetical protein FA15DRAFT_417920 [Coprinopsis marcescibilis]